MAPHSGKTTLVSIFSGIHKCDAGSMQKNEKPFIPGDIIEANKKGVSMIVQEMSAIDGLSIAQNIFFGHEKNFSKAGFLNIAKMKRIQRRRLLRYTYGK